MFQPRLQLRRTHEIDVQLGQLLTRWDATREEQLEFTIWALEVAQGAELMALEDPSRAAQSLRVERDLAHGRIAEHLLATSTIDLQLVSKRMFFEWLSGELQPQRLAA